jgi:hypothetical protein
MSIVRVSTLESDQRQGRGRAFKLCTGPQTDLLCQPHPVKQTLLLLCLGLPHQVPGIAQDKQGSGRVSLISVYLWCTCLGQQKEIYGKRPIRWPALPEKSVSTSWRRMWVWASAKCKQISHLNHPTLEVRMCTACFGTVLPGSTWKQLHAWPASS